MDVGFFPNGHKIFLIDIGFPAGHKGGPQSFSQQTLLPGLPDTTSTAPHLPSHVNGTNNSN